MKKYLMIIFILLVSLQSYGQGSNRLVSMKVITPKDYFNADNVSYLFWV